MTKEEVKQVALNILNSGKYPNTESKVILDLAILIVENKKLKEIITMY